MTNSTELEQRVLQASPEQLRLILIEEALGSARSTVQYWTEKANELGLQSVSRCRRIVTELLNGVRADGSPLSRQVSSLYLYLFRDLVEAQKSRDISKVQRVIQVLEVEHETWRQVCRQSVASAPLAAQLERRELESSVSKFPTELLEEQMSNVTISSKSGHIDFQA